MPENSDKLRPQSSLWLSPSPPPELSLSEPPLPEPSLPEPPLPEPLRSQLPLWPSPSPPSELSLPKPPLPELSLPEPPLPGPPLPGQALKNPYFMGVYQAKMPGHTESKPPKAFMDTQQALFPDDAGRDDPNIIQPLYSYPDKPALKACRRRKRVRPLPDNAKPMRLPSRMASLLKTEEREAEQRKVQAEEEAVNPQQSKENSDRTKRQK
ncbi:hypothetical protein FN846DRAFT_896666 [Sphaerosporella brunnea]|uniref:Uncharacterized protein n=1 Tax=Sphaerosporella brunnea TaxID=1250544 RepID=A0A5J5EB63_9PEZI|nr:hypothetical protein FN846DRAFT_896666 [Sphaerosporella brunnea]